MLRIGAALAGRSLWLMKNALSHRHPFRMSPRVEGRLLLVFPDGRFLTDHLYNRHPVMLHPYAVRAATWTLIEIQGRPIHA